MKTMAIDYAKKLDNAIDDVNKEYAIEAGVKIANDLQGALIAYGITWLYLADAAMHTTKLTARTVKTGIKKALIKGSELYYETATTVTIRR